MNELKLKMGNFQNECIFRIGWTLTEEDIGDLLLLLPPLLVLVMIQMGSSNVGQPPHFHFWWSWAPIIACQLHLHPLFGPFSLSSLATYDVLVFVFALFHPFRLLLCPVDLALSLDWLLSCKTNVFTTPSFSYDTRPFTHTAHIHPTASIHLLTHRTQPNNKKNRHHDWIWW